MKHFITAIIIITSILLTGCSTTPAKSDKQDRFEKVQRDADNATRELERNLNREYN